MKHDRLCTLKGIHVLRFTGKQVETETGWVLAQIEPALVSPSQAVIDNTVDAISSKCEEDRV